MGTWDFGLQDKTVASLWGAMLKRCRPAFRQMVKGRPVWWKLTWGGRYYYLSLRVGKVVLGESVNAEVWVV